VTRRGLRLVAAGVLIAIGIAAVVTFSDDGVTPLAVGTFVLAAAAALFALPGFMDRIRVPDITIELLTRTDENNEFKPVQGPSRSLELEPETVWVEVEARIHNKGKAPLLWAMLNIQLPYGLHFEVTDHAEKHHYENPHGGMSGDLWPGQDTRCALTVAEREFLPPHHFLYHVKVWVPVETGEWPIVALVEGGRPYRKHKDRIVFARRQDDDTG
jgi:hypothetical protein